MNNNKIMIELSLEDIINNRLQICLNSKYKDYCEGEITSYTEMLIDIKTMTIKEFSEKFSKELAVFDEEESIVEQPCNGKELPSKKVRMLRGHIHAINDILGLIIPSCQYRFRKKAVTNPLVNSDKKMMEITIKDIINYHLEFYSNNDDYFRDDEDVENDLRDRAYGYVLGYNQMIGDVEILTIREFYKKYIEIQNAIGEKLDQDDNHFKYHEIEILCGHNNAIGDILELINYN